MGSEEHIQFCFVLSHYCLCPCKDIQSEAGCSAASHWIGLECTVLVIGARGQIKADVAMTL